MTNVSYHDIEQARQREMTLRAQLRADLKIKRQEVRELKSQLVAVKAEDRAAQYAAMLADGGQERNGYAVKRSGKRFVIVPKDATLPVTRGDVRYLDAILASLV